MPPMQQEGTTALGDEPEQRLLDQEVLNELRRGVGLLKERERDALALRFAGGLKVAEVGQVLGLTVGAAQMLLHRAVHRLAALLEEEVPADARTRSLEDLVQAAVARHPEATGDPHLRSLVMHLAALHQPPLPTGLRGRIDACLACYPPDPTVRQERSTMTLRNFLTRAGISSIPGLGAAVAVPACVTCTLPAIWPTLAALSLIGPASLFHNLMLAVWPVFLFIVWRNYRVHRQPVGLWLMGIGGLLLLGRSIAHFATEGAGSLAFDGTNRAGNLFVIGGLVADYVIRIRGYLRHRALQRAMELQPGGAD